jgi:hypothetical protein
MPHRALKHLDRPFFRGPPGKRRPRLPNIIVKAIT